MVEIGGHVADLFSPPRYSKQAGAFGMRAGFSVDLSELKPNGERWDLSRDRDIKELERLQELEDPYLLVGTPPCEVFSQL